MRNNAKRKLLVLSLLILPAISTISACGNSNIGESFKTLFIPKADLSLTEIKSSDTEKGISILQTFKRDGTILTAQYKYNEPQLTIVNRAGLPKVIFKQAITQFTIGNTQIPPQKVAIAVTVPSGGTFSGSVPVLSSSSDILNAVFPNNSLATVQSALFQSTLLGVDDNNNLITLNFSGPIRFESDPANFQDPNAAASVAPSSTPTPVATP